MRPNQIVGWRCNVFALIAAMMLSSFSAAAAANLSGDWAGDWVGQITGPFDSEYTAQYSHVAVTADGAKINGTWGSYLLSGTITGGKADIALAGPTGAPAGTLHGTMTGDVFSGTGSLMSQTPGARAPEALSNITWKLSRPVALPAAPRSYNYDPKVFYGTYAAAEPPVLHIFPGDTVTTRTIDTTGRDLHAVRHGTGGDVNTGPFYVEGALPGDTLVVHLLKVQVAKPDARQGSRFNQYAVTQAYQLAAKYDPAFNGQWQQDSASMTATLPATPGLPHLTIPLKPMLGCISVAPPGEEQYIGTDLGPYGGNLDYNENVQGATLYFPVFHPGALLGMGDAHGAMGDGEVVGTGLETSADVTFTVDVIRGYATSQVRSENKDYLMSFGVGRSVPDSIQFATTQLAQWIKHDYKLNDSEVALLLGDTIKYDITELVDPQFDVVAKVPKSVLATLNK
jgi:amidase